MKLLIIKMKTLLHSCNIGTSMTNFSLSLNAPKYRSRNFTTQLQKLIYPATTYSPVAPSKFDVLILVIVVITLCPDG